MKQVMIDLLQKKIEFLRGEAVGTSYIFDYDIEIFLDEKGQIADYSGCGSETAKKLLNENNVKFI
jgi:galactitol-specific phosphotransferase system IIB component